MYVGLAVFLAGLVVPPAPTISSRRAAAAMCATERPTDGHAPPMLDSDAPLTLVEHAMPLLPPAEYEARVRHEFAGRGEIIRWYIARVDGTTAVAEVVLRTS